MTGRPELFSTLQNKDGGTVTFGDNNKGKVIGIGNIGNPKFPLIENVLLVDGLMHNLISISQLCDKGFHVSFENDLCLISDFQSKKIIFKGKRRNNVYELYLDELPSFNEKCLIVSNEIQWLWHKRLGHVNFKIISKLSKNDLVRGLPRIPYKKDHLCDACQRGKQIKSSFKAKDIVSTKRPLELLHLDLFGPSRIQSLNGSKYAFVIVDDYSRFTWVIFLKSKNDAFSEFSKLCRRITNEKSTSIIKIRSDHGGEFENESFLKFCDLHGISHNFAFPRAAPQNGVVERKNRTLQECARTMLQDKNLPKYFWAEAINTTCYVLNRVLIRPILHKTCFELYYDRIPKISYFKIFGSKCFLLNTKDNLDKFDSKSDESIFLGYSSRSKAYRIFNKRTSCIEESLHVVFDENCEQVIPLSEGEEVILQEEPLIESTSQENIPLQPVWKEVPNHPHEQVIGEIKSGVQTRRQLEKYIANVAFISKLEPKNINEACDDEFWLLAMSEELNQFTRNDVWDLVDRPKDHPVIGTRWVFRNKLDENGEVIRNKARLVAQGYNQEEGIDFDETYAPVARLESIRMMLAFASYMNFKLYQIDVKSAFLNGHINEEVYVEQPPGFENEKYPEKVYKLKRALYGLKQAPRAWYERLRNFLEQSGFSIGRVDSTLFIKNLNSDILIVQIYVDDIIFGSTNDSLCKEFAKAMQEEFEMSLMGELNYFLGLQIKQTEEGIFINQAKYTKELLKRFGMDSSKSRRNPMSTTTSLDKDENGKSVDTKLYRGMIGSLLYLTASRPDIMFSVCMCARFQANPKESHLTAVKQILRYLKDTSDFGLFYPKSSSFDLVSYSDADFAGSKSDHKSTSGTCHFLGNSLVSWFSKKQNSVSLSTTEAEYIAASLACSQVLWMKQTLKDFGLNYSTTTIYCDNTSAINLSKNPVQHSRTKHIEVRHHFLRDHVLKGDISLNFIFTKEQHADIFTKPLKNEDFMRIRRELAICSFLDL